jgi:hypothetical protein
MERGRVLDRAAEEPYDAEQQVRLPLGCRERAEQREDLVVAGDRGRQPLVGRRYATRLARGKVGVGRGGPARSRIRNRAESAWCPMSIRKLAPADPVASAAWILSRPVGLRKDWAAVRAGLTLPYSSGAVEGWATCPVLREPAPRAIP